MVRLVVHLPEEQAAALERAARRRGVSKSAVVRAALSQFLSIPEQELTSIALREAGRSEHDDRHPDEIVGYDEWGLPR